ncbi:MAG: hypothetical protein KAZ28_03740 [Bacteroidaceae bacterium]|nr:hypothetical protein [Bacteroidaceae bacterium]
MEKTNVVFIPNGGLANRMRAMASAYTLAKNIDCQIHAVWFRDWTLNATFHSIFEPISTEAIDVREANIWDKIVNERPRRKNLHIFLLPQKLFYRRRIYEAQVTPLKRSNFDFESWAKGHRCYFSSYQDFGTLDDSVYNKLFHPVKEVVDKVKTNTDKFSSHTIGIHIRRTDNSVSIAESPTKLFFQFADHELEKHNDTKIFLATDSEDVKSELIDRYGERIITSPSEADRNSTEGIRDGLADMYTLSKTIRIYGSAGSSFSPMAAKIGGNELIIVEKKH